jgi:hypothetical protein
MPTINSERLILAADYITEHGWTQGTFTASDGAVCLHGAIKSCTPVDGDTGIIRAVMRYKGFTEEWNDAGIRSADDVLAALRATVVTDEDLAETFGPQWAAIVALIRRAAALTEREAQDLDAAWDATWVAARDAARVATRDAARDAAWDAAMDAAMDTAWDAARDAAWDATRGATWGAAWDAARGATWGAAWDATRGATRALLVRDLIGQHGFKQHHYNTLVAPWVKVAGPVHPDDQALGEGEK